MPIVTSNANDVLGYLFGGADATSTYAAPAHYYVALSTTTPTVTGTNFTEPSGSGYARVEIDNDFTTWNTASGREVTNAIEIAFPESTASWGTITYIGFYDALTGGNLLYYNSVSSRVVYDATTVSFPADSITVSIPSS